MKSMIALLFALCSATALAQNQAQPTPPASKPVDDSASYGPVLNHPATQQATGEARPQAQEERAGQPPASKPVDADPSARPAPTPAQPQQPQPAKKPPQANRRAVQQRIDSTPRIAAPAPQAPARVAATPAPQPVGPTSAQVVGCLGGACTDTSGATINSAGSGNAGVSSNGRLCQRTGTTMQCF